MVGMSATVERQAPRRFLAWCEKCQDGFAGSKVKANKWAETHNASRHEDKK